jgi:diaminopimelate decarboxylase
MKSGTTSNHVNMEHYPSIPRNRSAIVQLLKSHGTPLFLGERANLVDRYKGLELSLEQHWSRHNIGYSFKTNYLAARCGVFRELGAWAEVVSAREYKLARELGFAGEAIIFNGPLKPAAALQAAFDDGALVNVNDPDELDEVIAIASRRGATLPIGIRVSSTLPRIGHSRFGFSLENSEAQDAVAKIRGSSRLELVALHTHLYGDTDDPDVYRIAAQRLGQFARDQIPEYAQSLKYVDMGGGFPAHSPKPNSRSTWDPRPIDEYIRHIADALRPYFPDAGTQPTLVVEPGRYLTCDAIVLVTRVTHVKQRGEKQLVNSDGSISMVPLTHYCPQIIRAYTSELNQRQGPPVATTIQGSTCRENDLLYDGPFPRVERGDYLVHFAAGAYNSSLSPDFIFASPPMEMF